MSFQLIYMSQPTANRKATILLIFVSFSLAVDEKWRLMLMSRAEWRRNARLSDNKTMDCLLNQSINAKALWFEFQLVLCGSNRGS